MTTRQNPTDQHRHRDALLHEWDREAWTNTAATPEVEKWQSRYIQLFLEMQKRGAIK